MVDSSNHETQGSASPREEVEELVRVVEQYLAKDFSLEAALHSGNPSFQELASFVHLLGRALEKSIQDLDRKEKELIQTAKLASLGEMTAGIGHELRNPVQIIKGYNDRIEGFLKKKGEAKEEEIHEPIQFVYKGIGMIRNCLKNFDEFSAEKQDQRQVVDLKELVRKVLSFLGEQLRADGIRVELKICEEEALIYASAHEIEQVLYNLIHNAVYSIRKRHSQQGGLLTLQVYRSKDRVLFSIQDNGEGIEEKYLQKIYDPFFSLKPKGKGTGLGLYISKTTVEGHEGSITCESSLGQGALFQLAFPYTKAN